MEQLSWKEENEKKKEYLNSYKKMMIQEKSLLEDIQELRASKLFPGAVCDDGMPKGGGCTDLSDFMVLMDEKVDKLKKERQERIIRMLDIKERIRSLSNADLEMVLEMRYIKFCEWEKIAVEMGYTYRHITRLHGEALKNIRCPIMS